MSISRPEFSRSHEPCSTALRTRLLNSMREDAGPLHSPCANQRGRRPHQVRCRQAKDRTAAPARPAPRRSPPRTRSGAGKGWSALGGDGPSLHGSVRPRGQAELRLSRLEGAVEAAGARETRLHDARHTAATVLLALEVPERTVIGVMGWSSTSMAVRYQHITDPIRHAKTETTSANRRLDL
jgi:Phage integrase family